MGAADLTDPAAVLAHADVRAVIDPAEPVCVVLGLALSLMPARQAREAVAGNADLIAPGSHVVISCVQPGLVAAQNWRGGWHVPVTPPRPAYVLAGVAKKKLRPGLAQSSTSR